MDYRDIRKEAKRQGFRAEPTHNGERLVPPDPVKPAVQVHGTPSDHRALKNTLAQLKRSGLQWPPKKGKEKKK